MGGVGPGRVTASSSAKTGSDSVSVGTSTAVLAAANESRISLYVSNDHASQVLYLGLGVPAVANKGIRVGPASAVPVRIDGFTGAVNAIASGAATVACITEI